MIARLVVQGSGALAPERIREALRATLEEPEFRETKPATSVLSDFWRWLEELFSFRWDPLEGLSGVIRFLVVFGLLLVLAALLYHIAWTFRRTWVAVREGRAAEPEAESQQKAAALSDLRARAAAAARSGDFVLAMRLYFVACVLLLSEKGAIEVRPGYTHREILARGGAPAHDRERLAPLVARLDRVWFGGETATAHDPEEFSLAYEGLAAERGA